MANERRSWTTEGHAAGRRRGRSTLTRAGTGVLDKRVLRHLAEDLGQPAADRLARRYAGELRQRLELLAVATFDGSVSAVYETAVGLATTGAMVGASELAQGTWAVAQDAVRYRILPPVETLERLMRMAYDTEAALLGCLGTPEAPA